MLSAPLIYLALSKRYISCVFFLFLYLLLGVFCVLNSHASCYIYFVAGAYAARFHLNINRPISIFLLCMIIAIYVIWSSSSIFLPVLNIPQLNQPRIILGLIGVWGLYDVIYKKLSLFSNLQTFAGYTFFVYLFHEPWINIYKKMALKLLGISTISLIAAYLIVPILMYVTSIYIAKLIRTLTPKIYTLLTGGRI